MRTLVLAALAATLGGPQPAPATLPYVQDWSDSGLISADDDWSGVPELVGHRGDGLTALAGVDPRSVTADGSSTPADVSANRTDPTAIGLAAGVAEFELADPVVALQGSATAAAPHLLLSLDTRGHRGVGVRLTLRDVDASSTSDAVQPVAVQYRVGGAGSFSAAHDGFVADATSGPGEATLVTPVRASLPAAADDQPLVRVRVITTNAIGQDEWVGIDDIEVASFGSPCTAPPPGPAPAPPPSGPAPPPAPPGPAPEPPIGPPPASDPAPVLSALEISPASFVAALRGPALSRRGRAGAALRFRLTGPATVRLAVVAIPGSMSPAPAATRWLSVRGRRGLNRLRFSGRLRGRPLAPGPYRLLAQAIDRGGRRSETASADFAIRARARPRRPGRT
jgi:hypothetical protein